MTLDQSLALLAPSTTVQNTLGPPRMGGERESWREALGGGVGWRSFGDPLGPAGDVEGGLVGRRAAGGAREGGREGGRSGGRGKKHAALP